MITTTGFESMIRAAWRTDARHFADKGLHAFLRIQNGPWPKARVADMVGARNVWMPGRAARVYAASASYGKPFLVPYDAHRFMPRSDAFLSCSQMPNYITYEVQRGWLLVTRSGRNLGPSVWVDAYTEQFVVSDDMIRVTGGDDEDRLYIMAFLHTPTGQQLIRRDKNGSVIDHIGPKQLQSLLIPMVNEGLRDLCVDQFKRAAQLREQSRLSLEQAMRDFLRLTGLEGVLSAIAQTARARRYDVDASGLGWRLDAEPHAPIYAALRTAVASTGQSHGLGDIADVYKPPGRYKTYYVDDPQYGRRLLSGRQLAQYRPVALKIISPLSFADPSQYVLEDRWVLMTADGRAEEHLADCALVMPDRAGWAASGHVTRLIPRDGLNAGLLYLACTSAPVQAQIKALATGSVVDALSVEDVRGVLVAVPTGSAADQLGDQAVAAWRGFSEAKALEDRAVNALEAELSG